MGELVGRGSHSELVLVRFAGEVGLELQKERPPKQAPCLRRGAGLEDGARHRNSGSGGRWGIAGGSGDEEGLGLQDSVGVGIASRGVWDCVCGNLVGG